MKRVLLPLALIASSACGACADAEQEPVRDVCVYTTGLPQGDDLVASAAAEWNAALGRTAVVLSDTCVGSGRYSVEVRFNAHVLCDDAYIEEHGGCPGGTMSWDDQVIRILPTWETNRVVLMHELGHAITQDREESDEPESVRHWRLLDDVPQRVTERDVAYVWARWGLPRPTLGQ